MNAKAFDLGSRLLTGVAVAILVAILSYLAVLAIVATGGGVAGPKAVVATMAISAFIAALVLKDEDLPPQDWTD